MSFSKYYYWEVLVALIWLVIVSLFSHKWINRQVKKEIELIKGYTESSLDKRLTQPFAGSRIVEFDLIGRTLESTFNRLTEQEKQFSDLFDYSLLPILFWNSEVRVVKINPAGKKMFQY